MPDLSHPQNINLFKNNTSVTTSEDFSYCTTDLKIELSHGKKQSVTNEEKTLEEYDRKSG